MHLKIWCDENSLIFFENEDTSAQEAAQPRLHVELNSDILFDLGFVSMIYATFG